MITDTKAGQTNYCPICEDQARRIMELECIVSDLSVGIDPEYEKRIEELERRERMLVDAAEQVCKKLEHPTDRVNAVDMWKLRDAINATPSHSAAWEWNQHVEWMKNLPIAAMVDAPYEVVDLLKDLPDETKLYAIPELKEVKE